LKPKRVRPHVDELRSPQTSVNTLYSNVRLSAISDRASSGTSSSTVRSQRHTTGVTSSPFADFNMAVNKHPADRLAPHRRVLLRVQASALTPATTRYWPAEAIATPR
jgi:hypothetical protein